MSPNPARPDLDAAAARWCPPGTAGRGPPPRSHGGQPRLVELAEQPPDRRVRHHRHNQTRLISQHRDVEADSALSPAATARSTRTRPGRPLPAADPQAVTPQRAHRSASSGRLHHRAAATQHARRHPGRPPAPPAGDERKCAPNVPSRRGMWTFSEPENPLPGRHFHRTYTPTLTRS